MYIYIHTHTLHNETEYQELGSFTERDHRTYIKIKCYLNFHHFWTSLSLEAFWGNKLWGLFLLLSLCLSRFIMPALVKFCHGSLLRTNCTELYVWVPELALPPSCKPGHLFNFLKFSLIELGTGTGDADVLSSSDRWQLCSNGHRHWI